MSSFLTLNEAAKEVNSAVYHYDEVNIILTTDPGEECDDLSALSMALRAPSNFHFHVVISGGKMSPKERMVYLSKHLRRNISIGASMHLEGEPRFTFYADGDVVALPMCDAYIGNGPVCNASLEVFKTKMKPASTAFLVGGKALGGVNSNGTNPKGVAPKWGSFVAKLEELGVNIVELLPADTRKVRFEKYDQYGGEFAFLCGMRSMVMFFASRIAVPARFLPLGTHERITEGNAFLCTEWEKEMFLRGVKLVVSSSTEEKARRKAGAYIECLMDIGHDVMGMEHDVANNDLYKHAFTCFRFTYAIAEMAGVKEELYAEGKFGFKPEDKGKENPGGCFADESFYSTIVEYVTELFRRGIVSGTPMYDCLSVRMCIEQL